MADYKSASERNAVLLIADSLSIMTARSLAGHLPTLVDGAILVFTEGLGIILLVDAVWLHFAKRAVQHTFRDTP